MKKILFVIEDLKFGGVEVSLVNLLNSIDFEEHNYSAVLLMWGKHYEIMSKLKKNPRVKVKIIKTKIAIASIHLPIFWLNKYQPLGSPPYTSSLCSSIQKSFGNLISKNNENARMKIKISI